VQDDPEDVLRRLSNVEGLGAYVLDPQGHILGVAPADILAHAIGQRRTSLADCLTGGYEQVGAETPLVDLCSLVGRHSVPLAVTDPAGRLLGVVPRAALLAAFANPRKVDNA
jgi:glycine betaine/proline transport system ATP-binding protein